MFDGGAFGIGRVDFGDPAVAVRLVRLGGQVVTRIELFIGIAPFAADAVARQTVGFVITAGGTEVAVEVFFAGQVGAPKRLARTAVVHRALRAHALGVGVRLHQRVTGCGAVHRHLGFMGDAAVVRAVLHHLIGAAVHRDLHDRHALKVLQKHHLVRVLRRAVRGGGKVDLGVHVFRVHGDQFLAIDKERLHPVRILTEHLVRHGGRNAGFGVIGPVSFGPERIAPAHQRFPFVAVGHVDVEVGRDVDRLETEATMGRSLRAA